MITLNSILTDLSDDQIKKVVAAGSSSHSNSHSNSHSSNSYHNYYSWGYWY